MYLKRTVVTFFIGCLAIAAVAQASLSSIVLSGLPGIEITKTRTFTAESLYGYMNGGAELYLEYGFDTLVVTEVTSGKNDIKIEFYCMSDAEAAFGIFSVSRFRCNGGPKLTVHQCRSAYQLQFCKGSYYVSIINDTGTDAEQKTANEIAGLLIRNIAEPPFDPVRFFEGGLDDETMKSAVLIRGPLGIYNGIPVLIDALGDLTGYSALIIRKDQKITGSLRFDTPAAASQFVNGRKSCVPADSSAGNNQSADSIVTPEHIIVTF
ncbi:MAG TPA: DUF6599 family protein [Bacteroidales bacterium]|nr:DUF6599 family protein [Bacteroidales bacterium]